jgi:hypothetical protein
MFIFFFFYLAEAEADPKFVNVDGLAAAAGQALLDKELTFLQGSFGILIVISCKYVISFLKMFGDRLLRNCEYYFFIFLIFLFIIFLFLLFQGNGGMTWSIISTPLPQQLQQLLHPTWSRWRSCSDSNSQCWGKSSCGRTCCPRPTF